MREKEAMIKTYRRFRPYFWLVAVVILMGMETVAVSSVSSSEQANCTHIRTWGLEGVENYDACTLQWIYDQGSKSKYRKLPPLAGGFDGHHHVDTMIQFWMDFWRSKGLVIPVKDALKIKALIAVESSFNPKAEAYADNSTAYGLMQITNTTRRILSGLPGKTGWTEVKSHRLFLTREDIENETVNIAAGIRWIAHKWSSLPSSVGKTERNSLKYYHSWDEQGELYFEKVEALYSLSKTIQRWKQIEPLTRLPATF